MAIKKILLCVDLEGENKKAVELALEIAEKTGAELTCLHVVDAYPKIYTNEIYAINRVECQIYLDRSQTREAQKTIDKIITQAKNMDIKCIPKLRYGFIIEEILKELQQEKYDLIVLGKRLHKRLVDKIRSDKIVEKLLKKVNVSVLIGMDNEI